MECNLVSSQFHFNLIKISMQQLQNSKDRTYISLITRTQNTSRNSTKSLQTRRDIFQVKFAFTRLDAEVSYYHYRLRIILAKKVKKGKSFKKSLLYSSPYEFRFQFFLVVIDELNMSDKGMSINNKEYRGLIFVEIRLELELKNAFTESFKLLLLMFISSLGYTRNKKLLGNQS